MKNILLSIFLFLGTLNYINAQLAVFYPENNQAQCVGEWITYSVESQYEITDVSWSAEHGIVQPKEDITQAEIYWDDNYATGTIYVTITYSNHNQYTNFGEVYALKTLHFKTPGEIHALNKLFEVGSTPTMNLWIEKITYPKATGEVTKYVNHYQWLFPEGWVCNGVVSDGVIPFIDDQNITVTADYYHGGPVKVWGINVCNENLFSQPKIENIERYIPPFELEFFGYNDFLDGDTRRFRADAPDYTDANYSWSVSTGWSTNNSTTHSCSIYPDGCSGSISCNISFPNGPSRQKQQDCIFEVYKDSNPPTTVGNYVICSSSTSYYCSGNLGRTVTWELSDNLDGGATGSQTSVWHKYGTPNGMGWIKPVLTSGCSQSKDGQAKEVWVGGADLNNITVYYSEDITGNYPDEFCPGDVNELLARANPSIDMGISSIYWDMGSWDVYYYDDEGYVLFEIPLDFYESQDVFYEVTNPCDIVITSNTLYEGTCGGYFMMISPVPSYGETIISIESTNEEELIDDTLEWELNVFDSKSES